MENAISEKSLDFKSSRLGTKEYWDSFYQLEHCNFERNEADTGECWFEESNAETKMCDFIFEELQHLKNPNVCDVGTGNGHLLFQLLEEGFKGNMVGIDYSETSVQFAKDIAARKNYQVKFERSDVLHANDPFMSQNNEAFDLVLDKGTLDAIALSNEQYENGLTGFQIYPYNVSKLIRRGGVLLVTSCNFTQDEIYKHFTDSGKFKYFGKVDYPTLEFGGAKGSTICTVAFEKL